MGGFFDKLRGGIARFMYGRNGADALNGAIFVVYLAVLVISALVVPQTTHVWIYALVNSLSFVLAIVYIFRAFSRNLDKRRAERRPVSPMVGAKASGGAGLEFPAAGPRPPLY